MVPKQRPSRLGAAAPYPNDGRSPVDGHILYVRVVGLIGPQPEKAVPGSAADDLDVVLAIARPNNSVGPDQVVNIAPVGSSADQAIPIPVDWGHAVAPHLERNNVRAVNVEIDRLARVCVAVVGRPPLAT